MATSASGSPPATPTDLTAVISSTGAHLLSFLPLACLINGYRSPSLVSTAFYDAVYHAIGTQFLTLSFSGCHHLRKIDDEALVKIIRNIIEINEAHHPEYERVVERRRSHNCACTVTCPCPIVAVKHVDLSRCRNIKGEGVHFALKHLKNVRRISLSGAKSINWLRHFVSEGVLPDCYNKVQLPRLEAIDLSACPKINDLGVRSLLASVQGHQRLRVLDLSGVSTQTNDDIAGPIASICRSLECLSLAGMKKVTSFGVGLIAYCCRDTLRSLSLRACSKVNLMELLCARIQHMGMLLANSDGEEGRGAARLPPQAILPPAFAGDPSNAGWSYTAYRREYALSIEQTVQILQADDSLGDYLIVSKSRESDFLRFEEQKLLNTKSTSSINNMFGKLEHLDIGHIGESGYKISGCLAAIAWLNGGCIRELNIAGLEKITTVELNLLATCSGERLQVLEMPASLMIPPFIGEIPPSNLYIFEFHVPSMLTELDLSCLSSSILSGDVDGTKFSFLSKLRNCRVLKLDHLPVEKFCLPQTSGLMKLSLQGCTKLTRDSIYEYLHHYYKGSISMILELDIREVPNPTNIPLRNFCQSLPKLLLLNNRRTKLGTALKDEHIQVQRWRIGAKIPTSKSRKRKAVTALQGNEVTSLDSTVITTGSSTSSSSDMPLSKACCSLLRTGFRKDRDTEQEMFACWTCKIDFGRFVCYNCAEKCHQGHDIVPIGFGAGYCDCSILSKCYCLNVCEEDDKGCNTEGPS